MKPIQYAYRRIVVLTGAGISAESGLDTFRTGKDGRRGAGVGLWAGHAVDKVATPEAYARDPYMVHDFYKWRRAELLGSDGHQQMNRSDNDDDDSSSNSSSRSRSNGQNMNHNNNNENQNQQEAEGDSTNANKSGGAKPNAAHIALALLQRKYEEANALKTLAVRGQEEGEETVSKLQNNNSNNDNNNEDIEDEHFLESYMSNRLSRRPSTNGNNSNNNNNSSSSSSSSNNISSEKHYSVTIITQNVDDLHERGGAAGVIHMHGSLTEMRCEATGRVHPWRRVAFDYDTDRCVCCDCGDSEDDEGVGETNDIHKNKNKNHDDNKNTLASANNNNSNAAATATDNGDSVKEGENSKNNNSNSNNNKNNIRGSRLRPNIVWFGEMPMHLNDIYSAVETADLFVAIGTSGLVYPAAGLAAHARSRGVPTLELNLAAADNCEVFDAAVYGPATEVVPAWVEAVLRGEKCV